MELRTSQEIPPHFLTWCGAAMLTVSASLPWLVGGRGTIGPLHPMLTDALRPSALVVLLVVVGGAAGAKRSVVATAIAGSGGFLWMMSALAVWLLGLRLQDLTPAALLPDGFALRTGVGTVFGIVGGFTLVLAALVEVSRVTWPAMTRFRLQVGRTGLVIGLSLLLVASRGVPWIRVNAGAERWSLGADAIPVVADVMGALALAGLVALWLWALDRRRITSVALLAIGLATSALGAVAGVVVGLMGAPIGALLRRLDVTTSSSVNVGAAWGPWALAIVGVVMVAIATASLIGGTAAVERSRERSPRPPSLTADVFAEGDPGRRVDDLPPR